MNNSNTTNTSDRDSLSLLKQIGQFELVPSDTKYDFEDKSRFTQLSLSDTQKMHLSAAYQHFPSMVAAGTLAQAYIARFPEGLPHTLTALKQGGFGSMIQGERGFVGTASFFPVNAQAIFLSTFTAMSVASGQYFLAKINSQLDVIQRRLGEILDFLYGDKKAELMAEISFTKYAFENYASIMTHESQRAATITSLQSAKKVAMNDIEFYIHDLSSTVESQEKDLEKVLDKTEQIRDSLHLSLELYAMSSLMEVYYAQNFDSSYLQYVQQEVEGYIEKCETRMLSNFNLLRGKIIGNNKKTSLPLGKGKDSTALGQRSLELTESVSDNNTKALRELIASSLCVASQPTEYYLTADGNIYCKN
ncbi:MAG: hypothetical protein ACOYBL_08080 [Lachnospiraceae bacterium]|jgi:hypothetical protein